MNKINKENLNDVAKICNYLISEAKKTRKVHIMCCFSYVCYGVIDCTCYFYRCGDAHSSGLIMLLLQPTLKK